MQDLIIQLITGALGGNVAGMALKDKSLGFLGNTVAGLIGGGGGCALLNTLAPTLLDGIAAKLGGAGIGGAIVMVIIGFIKNKLAAK